MSKCRKCDAQFHMGNTYYSYMNAGCCSQDCWDEVVKEANRQKSKEINDQGMDLVAIEKATHQYRIGELTAVELRHTLLAILNRYDDYWRLRKAEWDQNE